MQGETRKAIGVVEWRSIAVALEATDAMVKESEVEILQTQTHCAGKYVTIIGGDVASVNSSVAAGCEIGKYSLVDSIVIPNVHSAIFPALSATTEVKEIISLGTIECFSVAGAIMAADAAVKSADVQLIEIRTARGLGGKAFVTMTGQVDAVRTAVEAGRRLAQDKAILVGVSVIPNLSDQMKPYLL